MRNLKKRLMIQVPARINNIDLNGDGTTDYLKITEYQDGDAHTAIINAVVGENNLQTICTVEMEKISETEATLQLVGETEFYGEEIILEPETGTVEIGGSKEPYEKPDGNNGSGGPSFDLDNLYIPPPPAVVIVWGVYRPGYVLWVSSVVWGVYPAWYRPWPRYRRSVWRRHHYRRHAHYNRYRRTTTRRSTAARSLHYNNRRSHTPSTKPRTTSPNNRNSPSGGRKVGKREGFPIFHTI